MKTTPKCTAEDRDYQAFVESMAPHCHCSRNVPCDGVLAGGLCDGMNDDDFGTTFDDED